MDGRRLVAAVVRGGEGQNPAYRPTHPPARLSRLAYRPVQHPQRVVELLAGAPRQVVLQLVEQPIGKGVLACGLRGLGLAAQMGTADHTVLMVTVQRLDRLGSLSNLALARRRRRITKSLGALTDSVQRLILLGVGGLRCGLGRL